MPGEFDLIKRYFAASSQDAARRGDGYAITSSAFQRQVVLGPGDDAALLQPTPGHQWVISVDTSVADVHFPADAPPHAIGHRALAVSASDLAAMGAHPLGFTLSLTLPSLDEDWTADFARGLHALAERLDMPLVGGDTTQGPLSISITVLGEVAPGMVLRRDGASAGELIAVVGRLGGGCGGLRCWQAYQRGRSTLIDHYLYPYPLIAAGQALAGHASAAMDVSDGLLADLTHLCRASGVGAVLMLEALPLCEGLEAHFGMAAARDMALSGGDDYALLVTLPEASLPQAREALMAVGETLQVIGHTCVGSDVVDVDGQVLTAQGWQHFNADTPAGSSS